MKDDGAITDDDIARHHLVLWGDPRSNGLLARIAERLPFRWDERQLRVGGKTFSPAQHVPVLIFPNPLNPKRYVVLNSGFTFCDFRNASNAQQTPKLPDYAVLDVAVPRTAPLASRVVLAGFFDEDWRLPVEP